MFTITNNLFKIKVIFCNIYWLILSLLVFEQWVLKKMWDIQTWKVIEVRANIHKPSTVMEFVTNNIVFVSSVTTYGQWTENFKRTHNCIGLTCDTGLHVMCLLDCSHYHECSLSSYWERRSSIIKKQHMKGIFIFLDTCKVVVFTKTASTMYSVIVMWCPSPSFICCL